MGKHALLSASSSHRWLNCPPSARLCEKYEDTGSEYAQEGTDTHSLCEYKLKQALGMDAADPTENLSFYNEEMEQCALDYAAYVLELVEGAKKSCKDPVVLIEQRLDFSRFVKDGFGTGDCVIIADGTLDIVDYKHGKGVEVSAIENPQMMLYALGALELFDGIYDIDTVRMTIFQPRRDNMSVCIMAKDDLLQWAYNDLTYKAKLAYEGSGEFACGDWCRFCKAKAVCRKRAEYNLETAARMFHCRVEKHGENAELRQKGKQATLSCGYGGSVGALKAMGALEAGMTEEELQPLVDSWREANPNIVRFWWDVDRAVKDCIRQRVPTETHGLHFDYRSAMLFITLPSGRRLAYVKPRIGENQFGGESVTYMGVGGTKKWERLESYGPKFVENIVQGTARDILCYAMQTLKNCSIVAHVHDEIIIEADRRMSVAAVCEQMGRTPPWAKGLKLRADGYECEFYQKD